MFFHAFRKSFLKKPSRGGNANSLIGIYGKNNHNNNPSWCWDSNLPIIHSAFKDAAFFEGRMAFLFNKQMCLGLVGSEAAENAPSSSSNVDPGWIRQKETEEAPWEKSVRIIYPGELELYVGRNILWDQILPWDPSIHFRMVFQMFFFLWSRFPKHNFGWEVCGVKIHGDANPIKLDVCSEFVQWWCENPLWRLYVHKYDSLCHLCEENTRLVHVGASISSQCCSYEQWKKTGCLGKVGHYTTQLFGDCKKKQYKDTYWKTSIMESSKGLFCGSYVIIQNRNFLRCMASLFRTRGVIPYEAAVSCCVGKCLEMALDGELSLNN